MSSMEEFLFSSTTIDNNIPSPSRCCINSTAPSDFIDDLLKDPNNVDLSQFDPSVFDSFSDELIKGFEEAQSNVSNEELPEWLEQAIFSLDEHSENIGCQITEAPEEDSAIVVTLDVPSNSNSISNTQSLRLITQPDPYQRARYEDELDEDLRFISTPTNKGIELEMPDLRSRIPANMSLMMRVSRTTIPFDSDQTICCHPYPLYTKNEHAIAHHGSILFPVTDKNMEEQLIRIEDLIIQRIKQPTLKTIKQWPIYTSNQLDCNGFHSINIDKAKAIISTYNLRYSVLHFQIFLVDENQMAYATDLLCETTPIYEYEHKERENLPAPFGGKRKCQTKRSQQKSTTAQEEPAEKTPKQIKIKRLKGLIRSTNTEV
ncbi:unnamed protein product [Adineta steineri]|uniref:Uncharacterized protein n=1 Tax=Adineta steineri TaxID=433720 RepID=A0A815I8V0_9BILA|nr:unnamed protein product [Adineta steineri]CAF1365124.1 unnamed protein product [Adineta steineri]